MNLYNQSDSSKNQFAAHIRTTDTKHSSAASIQFHFGMLDINTASSERTSEHNNTRRIHIKNYLCRENLQLIISLGCGTDTGNTLSATLNFK